MTRSAIPLALLTFMLAATLAACDVRAQDDAPATAEAESTAQLARGVRVVRAQKGALTVTRSASATIGPLQESQISSSATGQIEAILAESGTQVAAGEAVIQLDDDALRLQLENAELTLQTARINLQKAERASGSSSAQSDAALQAAQSSQQIAQQQRDEGEKLLRAGGISQTEFAQLVVAFEQANAALIQAQAAASSSLRAPEEDLELLRLQVAQAGTQLEQAQQALADARITAPYAGEVAEILVNPGEFIGAGSPAFRLVGSDGQEAIFSVAPEDAAALQNQGQVWLPYNGLDYAAQVTRSAQAAGSRLVEVVAKLYPAETPIPNGTVTQFDYALELARGILIPSGALTQRGATSTVMIVRDGKAAEQTITIVSDGGAQLVVSGLEVGAQVIYPLPPDLTPGTPVELIGDGA